MVDKQDLKEVKKYFIASKVGLLEFVRLLLMKLVSTKATLHTFSQKHSYASFSSAS